MDKALTGYTYVRRYGNSYVVVVTKECDLLKIKNGELVRFRITKIQPEEPEVLEAPQEAPTEEVSQQPPEENKIPKKNSKKKKKEAPAEPE